MEWESTPTKIDRKEPVQRPPKERERPETPWGDGKGCGFARSALWTIIKCPRR